MQRNSASFVVLTTGLLLLLFFPLVVTNSLFFPFVLGRSLFFRLLVEFLFLVWFFLFLKKKVSLSGLSSPIFYALSAFLTVVFFADIVSPDRAASFLSSYERMEGFITYLHLFVLFVVAASALASRQLWQRMLLVSVGVSAFVSFAEVLKLFAGGAVVERLDGPFGNAAYFATYLLFHIFFIALLIWRARQEGLLVKRHRPFALLLLLALEIFVLYKTATRGALLALLIGALVTFFIWLIMRRAGKRKFVLVGAVFLIALSLAVGSAIFLKHADPVESRTLSRFQELVQGRISDSPRFMVWRTAWQGVLARPILGWGQESFPLVFERFYNPKLSLQESWFDRAHNSFLDWAVSAGFLGALAFLLLLLSPFFILWRKKEGEYVFSLAERTIFTGLLSAYFINILFVFDTLAGLIPLFLFLSYLSSQSSPEVLGWGLSRGSQRVLRAAVLFLVAAGVVFHVRAAVAGRLLTLSITPPEITPVLGRSAFFNRALSWTPFDKGRVRQEIAEFAVAVSRNQTVEEKEKRALFELGVREVSKEALRHPRVVKNFIFLGDLFRAYSEKDLAIVFLSHAKELSPSRKNIRKALGDIYMEEKKFAEAAQEYGALYELESRFDVSDPAYTFYIDNAMADYLAALILSGQSEKAEELVKSRFDGELWARPEVINAYAAVGEYGKVIALWKKLVEEAPGNSQNFFSLAAAYAKAGFLSEAISVLQDVAKRHPAVKEDAYFYIEAIMTGKKLPI
ncbi:hypothetical protein EPN83_00620 [Patescibacteria group bacterium]|nr:MAG: hypothetical protein EPN83_00620 [Patescibacteria group bacterium]